MSPGTSATKRSASWDLAGSILVPPRITSAAAIMIGLQMDENCLSKMALSFSYTLTQANCDRPVAASQLKTTVAMPVDTAVTKGIEEGRFYEVPQMRRLENYG